MYLTVADTGRLLLASVLLCLCLFVLRLVCVWLIVCGYFVVVLVVYICICLWSV